MTYALFGLLHTQESSCGALVDVAMAMYPRAANLWQSIPNNVLVKMWFRLWSLVGLLWCKICRRFEDKISGIMHFSKVWLDGSTNQKTSNIMDHAASDQHKMAWSHQQQHPARDWDKPITAYSSIAKAVTTMDECTRVRMKRKLTFLTR